MANYTATIATPRPIGEVFAYLSDFTSALEWDPGVVEAQRLDDRPIAQGSEFRLVAEFLGRKTSLLYKVVEFDPPNRVTFRGVNSTVVSLDRLTFENFGGGTRLTYEAELTLKGPLKLADPLLAMAFSRVGDRALQGLRETLARQQPDAGPLREPEKLSAAS
jgi:carbon monoxide dehydrogenase subunit G